MIVAFYSPNSGMGKTTAAEAAEKILGDLVILKSFSQPIKWGICEMLNHGYRYDDEHDAKNKPFNGFDFTYRDALICVAEAMKTLDPDIWVKIMDRSITELTKSEFSIIIDDLRFPQEYEMLRRHGAKIIKICRPCIDTPRVKLRRPGFASYQMPNRTEGLLEGYEFDAEILNDGSLEEFKERVVETVKSDEV